MIEKFKEIEDRITEHLKNKDANLLLPSMGLCNAPGSIWIPSLEGVFISTDKEDNEIYKGATKDSQNNPKYRLHAKGCLKIAMAANIAWNNVQSSTVNTGDKNVIGYRVEGSIRKETGELYSMQGYKSIDLTIVEDDLIDNYKKKRSDYDKKEPPWWKRMDDSQRTEYIDDCIQRDYRKSRRYAPESCETGAKYRVIKGLFPSIKSEYSLDQLKFPFVVLRYRPDLNHANPEIRAALLQESLKAAGCVFGPNMTALPGAQQAALPEPINMDDDPNLTQEYVHEWEGDYQENDKKMESMLKTQPPEIKWEDADHPGKIKIIESLIPRKGYDASKLHYPLVDPRWEDEKQLKSFYDHLMGMPDKEIPY